MKVSLYEVSARLGGKGRIRPERLAALCRWVPPAIAIYTRPDGVKRVLEADVPALIDRARAWQSRPPKSRPRRAAAPWPRKFG